ncbi:MAG: peptidylprolyl isomerase [Acidobacteriota bacterium]
MSPQIAVAVAALALVVWLSPTVALAHGFEVALQRLSDDEEAALIDSRSYTVGEIKTLLALRKARYRPGRAIEFGLQDLNQTAAEIPVYTRLAKIGREAGLQLTPSEKEQLDAMVEDAMLRQLFRDDVLARVPEPTLEQLRELYENVKDSRFLAPERLFALEIHLAFDSEEEEEASRTKIQKYWQTLEDGAEFPVLIRSIEDSAVSAGPLLIMPEKDTRTPRTLIEALRGLPVGEYSEPIKSENAWHLIYKHSDQPQGYIPFHSTTSTLADEFKARHRSTLTQDYFEDLTSERGLFSVHSAALLSQGELALDSDVLLTVAEVDITRGELTQAAGLELTRDVSLREKEFRRIALGTYPVQQRLLRVVAERRNYSEHPEIVFYRTALEETLLVRKLIISELDPARFQPDEEDILLYRDRELLQRGEDDVLGIFDRIFLRTNRREARELKKSFSNVTSYEEFQRQAERVADQESRSPWVRQIQRFRAQMPEALRQAARERGDETVVVERPDSETIAIYWLHRGPSEAALSAQARRRIESNVLQNRIQDQVDRVVGTESASTEMEWTLRLYN